jgi:Protein of unknown function (DUF732)
MRMRALTTSCVAIGVTLGLLCSPVAHADDADFVREVQAMGFLQAYDNLVSQAQSACYFLVRKRTPDEVEARILRYTRVDPPSQARPFLVLAVRTYCPQFTNLVGP